MMKNTLVAASLPYLWHARAKRITTSSKGQESNQTEPVAGIAKIGSELQRKLNRTMRFSESSPQLSR
eukprot:1385699-Rhodomonas_salina.2